MEGGELLHHALVLVLLVRVYGLSMLAKVVEARELLRAVAGERPLAGMLSGKVWASMSVTGVGTWAVRKGKKRAYRDRKWGKGDLDVGKRGVRT